MCSSGGHRLEPSFLNCTDAASFSDAHEELEIPVIAANVHRVMRPEKSQIWSVIRKDDSLKRICYSVTSTFLGMLCISGDVMELSEEQWDLIDSGISFYRKLDNIIKDGRTYYYGTKQASYRNLNGWQGILRKATKKQEACLILHGFSKNQKIQIPIEEDYKIDGVYQSVEHEYKIENGYFEVVLEEEYEAIAILLRRENKM